jgi:S1-C subfamily serine protease
MRIRPVLWALLLVGGFWYFTSASRWDLARLLRPVADTGALWTAPDTAHSAGVSSDEQNNIEIYKMANQATANVTSIVYRENFFWQLYPEQGQGSGFVIDADGHILTNNHVVRGTAELSVTLADKKRYRARILGTDPRNDLALIKIEAGRKLPFLKLGNSNDIQVGQKVLAIGNPFGLNGTLTTGVISSLGRTLEPEQGRALEDMIQTDCAINPGNSGGPLLDSDGSVVGINTAIYGSQGSIGIGFAMPINRAKAMLDEYRAKGRIARPWLGVTTMFIAGDLAAMLRMPEEGGLLIRTVENGSPAEEAGLRGADRVVIVGNARLPVGGDLIVAVEGQPVDNDALKQALDRKRAGDTLQVTIFRNGRTRNVTVRLGEAAQNL